MIPLQVTYENITLRDMVENDIADHLRWHTTDTAWDGWDAPDEPLEPIDPDTFRAEKLAHIRRTAAMPDNQLRRRFEVDADGQHIGWVSSYYFDREHLALGLDICESQHWGKGLGKRILAAFIQYMMSQGISELHLQTWSGNVRMIRAAQRVGFVECRRIVGNRHIRGGVYDSLTFRLDIEAFRQYLNESPA